MQRGEKLNWGSVYIDFDCAQGNSARRVAAGDADPSCQIVVNSKYNTTRNFTHDIEPGDHLVPTSDAQTTSAVEADGTGAVLVHSNPTTSSRQVVVDLTKFGAIAPGATVTPVVTTESPAADPTANALRSGTPVKVDPTTGKAVLTVPAKSVTTFVVDGVSGVAGSAVPLQDGTRYQLVGTGSGKALTAVAGTATPATTITTPATTTAAAAAQTWTVTRLDAGNGRDQRYLLATADGRYLARGAGGTALVTATPSAAAADPLLQWTLSSTDGSTYDVLNNGNTEVLDVNGASSAEGAGVGTWPANGGSNQGWSLRSLTPTGAVQPAVQTAPRVTPTLPTAVVPRYPWGTGAAVPVTWQTAGVDWATPRVAVVTGTATDVFGNAVPDVTARVAVGRFRTTDPTSVTVASGSSADALRAALPGTVPARVRELPSAFPTPVTWDAAGVDDADLASPGRFTVSGAAESNVAAAPKVPATLTVIVVGTTAGNVATAGDVAASATFTEPGYGVAGTRNGVTTDKAWSNWLSGTKRTSDTLTYTFDARTLTGGSVTFYRDGGASSWVASVALEYRDAASGAWVAGPDGAVTTVVPASGPVVTTGSLPDVRATGLRFVLTANPASHMVVSEVTVDAVTAAPSTAADLGALRITGNPDFAFGPATANDRVAKPANGYPRVTGVAVDGDANVSVRQATATNPRAVVTVTAPDGTTRRTWSVTFV